MPVLTVDEAIAFVADQRELGKKIIFTNGVFDLLHIGHGRYLKKARQLQPGSVLVVGVNSDRSARSLGKGEDRPVTPERERAELVAALSCVDAAVIFDESTPEELIARLSPDMLVKGSDWEGRENPGQKWVEARGGAMRFIPLETGYSTTSLLDKIKKPRA